MSTSTTKHTAGLDLDTLEDDGQIRPPYDFTFAGRTWTAYDPDRVDWTVIAALDSDDAREVLQVYLEPDDYAEFAQLKPAPPKWKVQRLLVALNRHFYGAEKPAGESPALPAS